MVNVLSGALLPFNTYTAGRNANQSCACLLRSPNFLVVQRGSPPSGKLAASTQTTTRSFTASKAGESHSQQWQEASQLGEDYSVTASTPKGFMGECTHSALEQPQRANVFSQKRSHQRLWRPVPGWNPRQVTFWKMNFLSEV